jgi:endonuclease/exonuclease/phosphatase family metal-dependent hydrolase
MSNLGYLRGIDGSLAHHLRFAHRHIYCSVGTQKRALKQLSNRLDKEDPDICCFVEIEKGSGGLSNFNQLAALTNERYSFYDIENKYGQTSWLRSLPFSRGKSNGFLAKHTLQYEKLYFTHGTKRLMYKITLPNHITLFFAHFSLKKNIRESQLLQVRQLMRDTSGESIFLGDFNILSGFQELVPLLHHSNLRLLNEESTPTFTLHRIRKALDLCICTESLVPRIDLKIIAQPYSDHAALLVEIR